jgi:glycosyltransferase involved in cell wall biosynthesis
MRFDIVHHGGGSVPRLGNKRTLLTVHDVQWTEYPHYVSTVKLKYLRNIVPSSLQRATRIAVPSWFVSTTLIKFFAVPQEKIGVVRHGLESTIDNDATSESELRERFGLGTGPVVVYPAITHPHKNHLFLLKLLASGGGAWADPELRVVFAGSAGSSDEEVRHTIKDLGLSDRVVMAGRVSHADRNGLLALSDAMVFPSEYEGFGAPVIEAMRFGTPVLCSDRGSIPEVAGDAALVRELTVEAWSHALTEVRNLRITLVGAGAERAERFTARLSAEDLVHQYDTVMAT